MKNNSKSSNKNKKNEGEEEEEVKIKKQPSKNQDFSESIKKNSNDDEKKKNVPKQKDEEKKEVKKQESKVEEKSSSKPKEEEKNKNEIKKENTKQKEEDNKQNNNLKNSPEKKGGTINNQNADSKNPNLSKDQIAYSSKEKSNQETPNRSGLNLNNKSNNSSLNNSLNYDTNLNNSGDYNTIKDKSSNINIGKTLANESLFNKKEPYDTLNRSNLVQGSEAKLSQNTVKLMQLEDRIMGIENIYVDFKEKVKMTMENREKTNKNAKDIYEETRKINEQFNQKLDEKIKTSLVKELDLASKKNVEYETKWVNANNKNYEYENIIKELEQQLFNLLNEKRKNIDDYRDLQNEHEYLKQKYDKLYIDYDKSVKSNLAKDDTIKQLKNEMDDMRNVIGKLTEVRVILNKYFSVNFENFTPQERRVINDVQKNVDNNYSKRDPQMNTITGNDKLKNSYYNNDEGFKDNNSNFSENTISSRTESKYKYIPQNSYQNDDDFWYQSNSNKTKNHKEYASSNNSETILPQINPNLLKNKLNYNENSNQYGYTPMNNLNVNNVPNSSYGYSSNNKNANNSNTGERLKVSNQGNKKLSNNFNNYS